MPSFAYRADCTIVLKPRDSALSLAAETASKKPLLQTSAHVAGRLRPDEHYDRLTSKPPVPFLVAGVRNVLSNLRCIAFTRATAHGAAGAEATEVCEAPAEVSGEQTSEPAAVSSAARRPLPVTRRFARLEEEYDFPGRPFHAICCRNGDVTVEEFTPRRMLSASQPDLAGVDWIVTGVPVCWDCDEDELFDRMVSDAADHSHIWHLPRGAHPDATPQSQSDWSRLQEIFIDTLGADRTTAATQLRSLAGTLQLQREREYLHSAWGVREDGQLVIHEAHGRLEELGARLQELGCPRGVCVENSGSIALYLVQDPEQRPWMPLISAPNFRPAGTAFVFFPLRDATFEVLGGNGAAD